MKAQLIPLLTLLLLLTVSCEKEKPVSYGFHCPIQDNSNGYTVMAVTSQAESVQLEGSVSVSEGSVEIILLGPGKEEIYKIAVEAPGHVTVNESFPARTGFWQLKYKSTKGNGNLELHLKYRGANQN